MMQLTRKSTKPSVFDPLPIQKGRIRYLITANVNSINFLSSDLHRAVGTVATTSILGCSIASSARVKRVEIFAPVFSSGQSAQCAIRCNGANSGTLSGNPDFGGDNGPKKIIYDTSMDVSDPAHVTYVPPRESIAGHWHPPNSATNANILFQLDCTTGGYMDVWYEYVLNRDGDIPTTSTTFTLAGATAGQIYVRTLTGSSSVTPDPNIYAVI